MTGSRSVWQIPHWRQKKILEDQDKRHAAVCSAYAASVYGLSVLADNINDEKEQFYQIYRDHQSESIPGRMQQRSVSAWNFHMKAVLFIICCRILHTMI